MKALFLTSVLGTVCVSAFAQGTLNFSNFGAGFQAQVTDTDGVTGLAGSSWNADLFWAPGVILGGPAELKASGQPASFSTNPQFAGYFFGGARTIPGTLPGEVITAQVRVWDSASGSSWAEASKVNGARIGESALFGVTLGGATPADMSGLNIPWSVQVVSIPEPSAIAFAGLGLVRILIQRGRREKCRGLNYPAAANLATTVCWHAEDRWREAAGRGGQPSSVGAVSL